MPPQTGRAILIAACISSLTACGRGPDLTSAVRVASPPQIDPNYAGIVIPPNIAPLNFRILEDGRDCVVRISSDGAMPVELHCPDRECRIGIKAWRQLLARNTGRRLSYDVFVRKADGAWTRYAAFSNQVADEPIDSHFVYRRLLPNDHITDIKGIFQRDLESFETAPILNVPGKMIGCYNCHTFSQHNPDRWFFHLRGAKGGMVFLLDGRIRKINTQPPPLSRPMAYASWHPDGVQIVGSVNDEYCTLFTSTARMTHFEAAHMRADLVVYNLETNVMSTSPQVFDNEYIQTHPSWSADGKSIFYIRCRRQPLNAYQDLTKFRFDLMRIPYDVASETWGAPEMLVECSKEGKSCTFPRPSPDGRYLLCVLCDKTSFSVYQNSADLYLFDLQSKTLRRLDAVNSDFADSFPCWSSNGRWFCFSSNRRDGHSALPYFAYFDAQGRAHKPFVLPQEDPGFYDTYVDSYNAGQLVNGEVKLAPFKLAEALRQPGEAAQFPNPPRMNARTGATPPVPGSSWMNKGEKTP